MNRLGDPTNGDPTNGDRRSVGDFSVTLPFEKSMLTGKLVEVLDQYLADLQDGKSPSRSEVLANNPELATQLDACLAGIDFIQGTSEAESQHESLPKLADFQILREVGRGGMGVVYAAKQTSLDRLVALKVLRFGAVSDPAALERFRREAETVAKLHHTNIVPIYSFGSDNGVNFYAMEFIEGQSLDLVLRHSPEPLNILDVASWGLQAAEALDHAHQRNVVHRDVKPSNLIRDGEGRVWLTDFGLAKRLDDVTLSMTGALLGTPRYMSPEQAGASTKNVDHRSDLYSLGAALYELLTGKPVFEGDSYHAVIGKILEEEPTAPSLLRKEIPRDLETILLKCLSKSPGKRYESAEDLAEDLRAFLHHRPISARRASLVERSARWLQRNQRSVTRTAVTIGATAAAILVALIGWRSYVQSNLASLKLDSDEPLAAEINEPSGNRRTVTLPMLEPIQVRSGDIGVRVSAEGRLSHDYQTTIPPGQLANLHLSSDASEIDHRLDVPEEHQLLAFEDGVDVILLNRGLIRRHDPVTEKTLWSLNLSDPIDELLLSENDFSSMKNGDTLLLASAMDPTEQVDCFAEETVSRARDLNGDGEGDIVFAARNHTSLLAVSGNDGKPLWISKFSPTTNQQDPASTRQNNITTTFSLTHSVGDLDHDGVADLLMTFGEMSAAESGTTAVDKGPRTNNVRRWIAAVSGASGNTIWQEVLKAEWFQVSKDQSIPLTFSWFPQGRGNKGWSGSSGSFRRGDMIFRNITRDYYMDGLRAFAPDQPQPLIRKDNRSSDQVADAGGPPTIGTLAGTHLIVHDASSGKLVATIDTKIVPIQPAIWRDLDGDAIADAILLEQNATNQMRCSAWSVTKQEMLWEKDITARPSIFRDQPQLPGFWPVVIDLDGDQRAEIILPSDSSRPLPSHQSRFPWGELQVFRGDGEKLWSQRVITMDQQVDFIAVGPDLNGDNVREIFTAAMWGKKCDLYFNAFSGADGDSLWWASQSMPAQSNASTDYFLGSLRWWNAGPESPLVVAEAFSEQSDRPSQFCAVSAATGRVIHTVSGVDEVLPADADADMVQELFTFSKVRRHSSSDPAGHLEMIPGVRERWRRLAGPHWTVAADLNGDGVRDLMSKSVGSMHQAISGSEGRLLWQTGHETGNTTIVAGVGEPITSDASRPRERWDLDGDKIPDLIAWENTGASSQSSQPIQAISGKNGDRLWTADISVNVLAAVPCLDVRDLDSDGDPEVMVIAAMDWGYGRRRGYGTNDQQLWLAVLEGSSGRVIWKQALSAVYGSQANSARLPYRFDDLSLAIACVDLNDDSVLDVVVPGEAEQGHPATELRGLNGKTGESLWQLPLPKVDPSEHPFRCIAEVTVADLDLDGQPEILAMAMETDNSRVNDRSARRHHLFALERDGQLRWQWQTETPELFQRDRDEPLDRRGPLVVRTRDGTPLICLPITGRDELVLLNHAGQPTLRHPIDSWIGDRVWVVDVDRDGVDELILSGAKGISAIQFDPEVTPLELTRSWRLDFDDFDSRRDPQLGPQVLGLYPGNEHQPPSVLLRAGPNNNSLLGIDTMTGDTRWRCRGPDPRNRFGRIRIETIQPLTADPTRPPQVFFHTGHKAHCRQAHWITETGTKISPSASDLNESLVVRSNALDPRFKRQLPWDRYFSDVLGELASYGILGLFYCITLIVLPTVYGLSLLHRRRWGLRTFALLPLIAALWMTGLTADLPGPAVLSTIQRFVIAVGFLPAVLFVSVIVFLTMQHQWRQMRWWLGLATAITVVTAGISLWLHAGTEPWLPGEHYSLAGWYLIFLAGAYFTGILMVYLVPRMVRTLNGLPPRDSVVLRA